MRQKYAVVFNANDPQIPPAHLFIESLRDPHRGAYHGDIWIVSTKLSSDAKAYAKINDIQFIEDPMEFLWNWPGWRFAARYQQSITQEKSPKKSPLTFARLRYLSESYVRNLLNSFKKERSIQSNYLLEKRLKDCFIKYRNKRLSKLLFLQFLEEQGHNYTKVVLSDTDLLVQSPIQNVFDQIVENKVYYWNESNPILPGTSLWKKNLAYRTLIESGHSTPDFGKYEINIGFLAGKTEVLNQVLTLQKKLYLKEKHVKLISSGWHEQDYFRLLREMHPNLFTLFKEDTIVHLCNGGQMLVEEIRPLEFWYTISKKKPVLVHFAGETWKSYDSINKTYRMNVDEFLSYYVKSKS